MKIFYTFLFSPIHTDTITDHRQTRSDSLWTPVSSVRINTLKKITLCLTLLFLGTTAAMLRAEVTVVSADAEGLHGNRESEFSSISTNGGLVVFSTASSNLVQDDTNNESDVFVKNVATGEIIRMSEDAEGVLGIEGSYNPSISADGRLVTFPSSASNLVMSDTNNTVDVFVKNVETGEIVRVSEDLVGRQADGDSNRSSISADGRFVAFSSRASNLVPGGTNDQVDLFVKNVETGEINLVSGDLSGVLGNESSYEPSISADGRVVAFYSNASNLVPDDTNDQSDVFMKNVETGEIVRVSEDAEGAQANGGSSHPSISADGRFIAFDSTADNLLQDDTFDNRNVFVQDVFVKNVETGNVIRVSENAVGVKGFGSSFEASISADGRFVAFTSGANNLVQNDNCFSDVFVKNIETGEIVRVSEGPGGAELGVQANDGSGIPNISADGLFVSFSSDASNLVPEDNNGRADVYLADVVWPDAPTSPLNLRYAVYSDAVAEVFWDRLFHDGGILYEVTRNGELIGLFDKLSILEYELQPNVQSIYAVTAIDNNGNRLATESLSVSTSCIDFNTKPSNPSSPGSPNFAIYSDTAAEVFWGRSTDDGFVSGYEITRNGQFDGVTGAQSVFHDDLIAGVTNTFTITAIDNDGERSTSASIQFTTGGDATGLGSPPSAPNLQSAVYSKTSAEIFWERSNDNALVIGYEVIRNGESRGILDVLSVFDDDLTRGVVYLYEITAIDADGNRSATSRMRVTTGDVGTQVDGPAPPDGLRVVQYSSVAAELFWERSVVLGLHYEIERDGVVLEINDGTSYFDNTLLPNVRLFEYSVVTIDADDQRSTAATIKLGPVPSYSIGDTGPGGGIVFYVSDDGENGLEAAQVDQSSSKWCTNDPRQFDIEGIDNLDSESALDSNSGAANTVLIVQACGPSSAAWVAATYKWPNGQSDGFLPNKEELILLEGQVDRFTGFVLDFYWSSSEFDANNAWFHNFSNDDLVSNSKGNNNRVRAVRVFNR